MDLEALRTRIAEILERLAGEGIASLSTDELTEVQNELLESFTAAQGIGGTEGLTEANRCRDGILQVRAAQVARTEEAARVAEEFDRLAQEIAEPEPVPDPEPEPVVDVDAETPAEADEDVYAPVATEQPAAAPVAAEVPAVPVVVEVVPDAASAPVLVPAGVVTAPMPARPSRGAPISQVAANRQSRPSVPAVPKDRPLTAKYELSEDGKVTPKNRRDVLEAFGRVHDRWARSTGISMNVPVVHVEWEYPESRDLRDIASAPDAVTRRFDETFAPEALTAAGGICAPFPVDYTLLNISEDVRPVKNNLPSFAAPRGGVQFMPSYVLSDVLSGVTPTPGNAISEYTLANDVAAATKPCQTFTCKTVTSCQVYAITRCVTFGNWNQRFYPELIDNILSQVMAVQARFAEEQLLKAICAGSTAVDFNGVSFAGATVSLLAAVGRASARLIASNRAPSGTLRVAFPSWVRDLVREDMSARLAYANEQFAIIDAWFDAQVRLRGANPWYFIDGQNDVQGLYAPITAGPLNAFPHTVVFYEYFEGAWSMLDGGTMDLGIVRDSVLNPTNNFQMFAETWEGLCNRGLPSLCVTATVCPNGASAGTYAPEPCTS